MLPVVLHHGMFGYDRSRVGPIRRTYFAGGIHGAIIDRGHTLICGKVSRIASIAVRAAELKQIVLNHSHGSPGWDDRVVIIAHSMGGLDARYMISKLGMADRVAALVTLSTPHRGSSYSDWVLDFIGRRSMHNLFKLLQIDLEGAMNMTRGSMANFNEEVPDAPGVRYFSVSASRPFHRVNPMLMHSHRIVTREEGENDGVVSVASAAWGEHLETWPVDHLHVVNRRFLPPLHGRNGNIRHWYMRILDRLSAEGILARRTIEFE